MQLNAYRKLNVLFLAMTAGTMLMLVLCLLIFQENRMVLLLSVVCIFLELLLYPYLERRMPQKEIQQCLSQGNIALMNIDSISEEKVVRDSSLRPFCLMKVKGTLYTKNHVKKDVEFFDRFSMGKENCSKGSVYVVYDEENPNRISLIPTELIMRFKNLQEIIESYEENPEIQIQYRNVAYDYGFFIESMRSVVRKAGNPA